MVTFNEVAYTIRQYFLERNIDVPSIILTWDDASMYRMEQALKLEVTPYTLLPYPVNFDKFEMQGLNFTLENTGMK